MKINLKKMKVTVISNKEGCYLTADGRQLEQVQQYKYLGSIVTDDGRCEKEVKTRIAVVKKAFWQHRVVQRKSENSNKETLVGWLCCQ